MTNVISHRGVIERMDNSHLYVRIMQVSACASCSVKGHCSAADSKEKIIEINNFDGQYQIGETVEIYGETSMGMKAVLLAFVIPFLIIIISLFILMSVTNGNELLSTGGALLLLVIYYLILSKNKKQLKKEFSFKIKSINN
jgi:Positive regulator of sigma E activity